MKQRGPEGGEEARLEWPNGHVMTLNGSGRFGFTAVCGARAMGGAGSVAVAGAAAWLRAPFSLCSRCDSARRMTFKKSSST